MSSFVCPLFFCQTMQPSYSALQSDKSPMPWQSRGFLSSGNVAGTNTCGRKNWEEEWGVRVMQRVSVAKLLWRYRTTPSHKASMRFTSEPKRSLLSNDQRELSSKQQAVGVAKRVPTLISVKRGSVLYQGWCRYSIDE